EDLTIETTGTLGDLLLNSADELVLTANGADLTLASDFNTGVNIGSSANTPAPLSISGGIGGNAALVVNQTNSGDLITASASGTTKFNVANNGDIQFTGNTNFLNILTSAAAGSAQTYTFPAVGGTICIQNS